MWAFFGKKKKPAEAGGALRAWPEQSAGSLGQGDALSGTFACRRADGRERPVLSFTGGSELLYLSLNCGEMRFGSAPVLNQIFEALALRNLLGDELGFSEYEHPHVVGLTARDLFGAFFSRQNLYAPRLSCGHRSRIGGVSGSDFVGGAQLSSSPARGEGITAMTYRTKK